MITSSPESNPLQLSFSPHLWSKSQYTARKIMIMKEQCKITETSFTFFPWR